MTDDQSKPLDQSANPAPEHPPAQVGKPEGSKPEGGDSSGLPEHEQPEQEQPEHELDQEQQHTNTGTSGADAGAAEDSGQPNSVDAQHEVKPVDSEAAANLNKPVGDTDQQREQ